MSEALRERLLEAALERLAAEESEPLRAERLAARVRSRLETSRPGDSPPRGTLAPTPSRAREHAPPGAILLAAASLLALAGLLPRLLRPGPVDRPRDPVRVVLLPADPASPAARALHPGEVLALAPDRSPRLLELGTTRLRLEPGSRLRVPRDSSGAELALQQGALELLGPTASDAVGTLAVGAARLELVGAPRGRVELDPAAPGGAREARVAVEEGYLFLVHGPDVEELIAGTDRRLALEADGGVRPLDDRERLADLLERLRAALEPIPPGPGALALQVGMWSEPWYPRLQLAGLLAARPARWALVADDLHAHFAARFRHPLLSAVLLDLVVGDGSPAAVELARDLWRLRPEDFSLQHVLALHERGLFEFERETRALFELTEDEGERTFAAARLALDGDEPALAWLARRSLVPSADALAKGAPDDGSLAALVALARRGEPSGWRELVELAAAEVPRWLDRAEGDPLLGRRAAELVLDLEFAAGVIEHADPRLGFFPHRRLARHRSERIEDLDERQVLERLHGLRR